jgi:hypothetical protein
VRVLDTEQRQQSDARARVRASVSASQSAYVLRDESDARELQTYAQSFLNFSRERVDKPAVAG